MGRRKIPTGAPLPKALACGMLEDNTRILFLVRKDAQGIEKIELANVLVYSGRNPLAELKLEFAKQTGIMDAQVGEIKETKTELRFNAGSRKRKEWVPCLVFEVTARNRSAKPSSEFSGFKWLSIKDAKEMKLTKRSEWVRKMM
ncbi:hypothetical protein HY988_02335 [Candidatus Micrarchaeota archaeon]|nr:hypothetical protein [Candidatus Micrarchaeota archaeon]